MKIETCGICDVSICNHALKLVEAGYQCGQDRNYTRIGNVFNSASLNKEVEWRPWFSGTQGGKFK